MNNIKIKVKQIFCNHESQKCLSVIDSNYLYYLSAGKIPSKTVWECQRCGKIIYKRYNESPLSTIHWILPKIYKTEE